MKKLFIIIYFILIGSLSIFAQTEQYSAKINWEYYRISEKKVSLLLPKLPVLISESNICIQTQIDKYAVYADDVVYGLNIISKLNEKVPGFCPAKREFSEKSFNLRMDEVKNQLKTSDSKKVKINDLEAEFVEGESLNYWFINDYKNKQWFELWTANSDENKKEVKEFLNSLKLGEVFSGIEIGKGSPKSLGDLIIETPNSQKQVAKDSGSGFGSGSGSGSTTDKKNETISGVKTIPLSLVLKPNPKYTDAARQNNVQGTVVLRVTFLANGGIGGISPVNGLPFGLTEQAIAAAGKLVFLPARRNGVKVSTTKTVQYTFTIY